MTPRSLIFVVLAGCSGNASTSDADAGSGDADAMIVEPPPSCPADNMGPGAAPNGTIPGTLTFPHPTIHNATILWDVSGDENANGVVTVRYRKRGATSWLRAMPLRRAPAGTIGSYSWTDRQSGSLFDLEAATDYEVELFLLDSDGGCELRTGTFATRPIPVPMQGAPIKSATPATLATVLQGAVAGDIIELGTGTYAGFTMGTSGTANAPIVIRARSGETATVNGEVVVSSRQHVHVSGLTVNGRIRANASIGIAITRNVVNATGSTGNGIEANVMAEDSYIADNIVTGTTTWAESSLGVNGNNLGDGISVSGPGHAVEHNRVSGFRDCLSTLETSAGDAPLFSIDFVENDVDNCGDDGIEADYCRHNCRMIRNRITNAFMMATSQPGYGGPTYFIRNVGYNVILSAFKLHNGTVGDVILHNTVVKSGNAFSVNASVVFSRQYVRNNVFIGGPGGTYNGYSNGNGQVIYLPYADPSGNYDYDGLGSTSGTFSGQLGGDTFASLSELTAKTSEKHAVHIDLGIFAATVAYPANPFPAKSVADLRLANGCGACDVAEPIPNVNDGFAGSAPDLGAFEVGAPLPAYGPR
jgi:hypothetical protein